MDPLADPELRTWLPRRVNKAVLVVDLVESMRLMAADERRVVARWQGFLRFARQSIPAHAGRLVKSLGDGILAEFDECRDAVQASHQLHGYFNLQNAALPSHQQMRLRAGVNATHCYADEHDIYGHGVNLAARVAGLALPGGTVVTASVRDALAKGQNVQLHDMGESFLKHCPDAVRTWSIAPMRPVPQHTSMA